MFGGLGFESGTPTRVDPWVRDPKFTIVIGIVGLVITYSGDEINLQLTTYWGDFGHPVILPAGHPSISIPEVGSLDHPGPDPRIHGTILYENLHENYKSMLNKI